MNGQVARVVTQTMDNHLKVKVTSHTTKTSLKFIANACSLLLCFEKKKKNCSINDSKINNATHNHKKKKWWQIVVWALVRLMQFHLKWMKSYKINDIGIQFDAFIFVWFNSSYL